MQYQLKNNTKQTEYLEKIFYGTRSVYNELLSNFNRKYFVNNRELAVEEVTVEKLLSSLPELPSFTAISNTCTGVINEKVKELSSRITVFLNKEDKDLECYVRYEDRDSVRACVFPAGSYHVNNNQLFLPGLETPATIDVSLCGDISRKYLKIYRLAIDEYLFKLIDIT